MPSSLTTVNANAFAFCAKLKQVVMGERLGIMSNDALFCCDALKAVYFTGDYCDDHQKLNVPKTTKIGPSPDAMAGKFRVWDLRKLKDVVIPEDIDRVGNYWFYNSSIQRVQIPASVIEIGTCAFYGCRQLRYAKFQGRADDSDPEVDQPAEQSRLMVVGREAFCNCVCLSWVELPDSVVEIGLDAFCHSGIRSFKAPKSLRIIR